MKSHQTLRRMLVHTNNKRKVRYMVGVVYQILWKDYPKIYMGETGRRYGDQEKEHMRDVTSLEEAKLTSSRKKKTL